MHDVIIIGGGPAGSTAATLLAQHGHDVMLLEREKFPRDHVGESLLPFCYSIFDQLGVLDEMTKRFVRKPGVRFISGDGSRSTTWCFDHVIKDSSYLSFQVNRSEFDKLLLDNSRANGATVEEQMRVRDVDLDSADGRVKVRAVGSNGEEKRYDAKFLIDASGRSAFIASRMAWRKPVEGLDRTALWTHWTGINATSGLEEGISLIVYLGGEKKGWIWIFPLETNRFTVGVVLNNSYVRAQKARLDGNGSGDWQMDLFSQELDSSPLAKKILEGGGTAQPLTVEGDYSYHLGSHKKHGPRFALIGDASTFLDPIFSSGVFIAMNSGRLLSDAVHQRLTSGEEEGERAIASAYERINGAYGIIHRLIRGFYDPHASTFANVGTVAEAEHLRHEGAMAAGHFLLAGNFFEDYRRFDKFFDLIEDPSNFERYKDLVLDREEFEATSCGAKQSDVFPQFAR